VHLAGDGHLDVELVCESHGGFGREDAFGDHPVHSGDDVIEAPAAAEFDSNRAIAREAARAGEDKVAHASETGHGRGFSAAANREARDLCEAARDESRHAVMSQTEAIADSGSDRNHVLKRASHLDADDIIVGVNPEAGIAELALNVLRKLAIL